jgi:uncharacterized protein (TIGR02466 family)
MRLHALFPSHVYQSALTKRQAEVLNPRIVAEALQLRDDDGAGRRWSAKNYPNGYTSYGSAHRLHALSPTFAELKDRLDPHVRRFAATLAWDMKGRRLEMTDCWLNIMGRGSHHGLHLHPLASVSGTYYAKAPKGSPGLKFEDPRLGKFMAAPPRRASAPRHLQPWVSFDAQPGHLLLFESWLRHEVVANPVTALRVSVSFNYNWF